MKKSLNKVFLLGHLGHHPDLKVSKTGAPFTRLNLATQYHRKEGETGEYIAQTEWHNIWVWGKQAELCSERLSKGALVFVEGYLSSFKVDSGEDHKEKRQAITAERVTFFNARPAPIQEMPAS